MALTDRGGVAGGLHLLRVVAARHHARARGDLCVREPVRCRAARLHHWPRSVLARTVGGGTRQAAAETPSEEVGQEKRMRVEGR